MTFIGTIFPGAGPGSGTLFNRRQHLRIARWGRVDVLASARHALLAMSAMVALAAVVLWSGLLRSFSLEYVASLFEHHASDDL